MQARSARILISAVGALALVGMVWLLARDSPPRGASEQPAESAAAPALEAEEPEKTNARETRLTTFAGEIMGTSYRVRARLAAKGEDATGDSAGEEALAQDAALPSVSDITAAVHAAFVKVDEAMSTYRPESELSQLNRTPARKPIEVSEPLWQVLSLSEEIHERTDGAFDVTVGPLVSAWGFGVAAQPTPPSDQELAQLRKRVGMNHLRFHRDTQRVEKLVPGLSVDLSAIAKGYAIDRAALSLERLGVVDYLVELGGEVRVRGRPAPDRPWKIGIERPTRRTQSLFGRVELDQGALATSGDYRNFRHIDGEVVSHIVDPRTGHPVERKTALVSVVHESAAKADALATGLFVLESDQALALANEEGWAILLLLHAEQGRFIPKMSEGFRKLRFAAGDNRAAGRD